MSIRQVTIDAVREHPDTKQSFVALKDEHGNSLVIWIGRPEALTIAAGLNEISPPRPMTAHLMASLFDVTGIQLKEVRIETCKDDIFYAVITVVNGKAEHDLDARPSDALALAVLLKRPIYVAGTLLEHFEQAKPFEHIGHLTAFREVDRDVVLNEHAAQRENLLQLFASLTRSNLESELQQDKEEREKTKQQVIDSWKEEHKQNQ
jgi:bifunctional DNase/RNase